MKYKIGDEVLVKVRIHHIVNQETDMPYEVKERNNREIKPRTIWIREEDIQSDPQMSAEEAWEITKRLFLSECDGIINAFSDKELKYIFGTRDLAEIVNGNTPQQAKSKIEAWEAEKEIKVGDIVRPKTTKEREYMVTYISESRKLAGVCLQTGEVIPEAFEVSADSVVKTGRHIDIAGILNQIGGTDA